MVRQFKNISRFLSVPGHFGTYALKDYVLKNES